MISPYNPNPHPERKQLIAVIGILIIMGIFIYALHQGTAAHKEKTQNSTEIITP